MVSVDVKPHVSFLPQALRGHLKYYTQWKAKAISVSSVHTVTDLTSILTTFSRANVILFSETFKLSTSGHHAAWTLVIHPLTDCPYWQSINGDVFPLCVVHSRQRQLLHVDPSQWSPAALAESGLSTGVGPTRTQPLKPGAGSHAAEELLISLHVTLASLRV